MLNYAELDQLLVRAQADVPAAACHGFLCGQICATRWPDEARWQEFLDVRCMDDDVVNGCYAEVEALTKLIREQLNSPEMEFNLLLPDDACRLEDRVDALAQWCSGFLEGISAVEDEERLELGEECMEILQDVSMICRAGVGEEFDEEDEKMLVELVEYVRMGAVVIYEENNELCGAEYPQVIH